MKKMIRCGVFETNSSSVHSLTICTEAEYEAWQDGSMVYDDWGNELIPRDEVEEGYEVDNNDRYFDIPDAWFDKQGLENYYDTFNREYTTPNGEKIRAFGYYGHD